MNFYAHTLENHPKTEWEPLVTPFDELDKNDPTKGCSGNNAEPCIHCENLEPHHGHLNKVAHLSGRFAEQMFPEGPKREIAKQWGYLAGLWHDLGKFSTAFQNYLCKASDPHSDEVLEKIDHTTAGAKHAIAQSPFGHFIATAIAGHHAGLLDARHESHASLEKRLSKNFGKEIPNITAPLDLTQRDLPLLPGFLQQKSPHFSASFYQRMIFSCLVDADFLATEAFMNPGQAKLRPQLASDIYNQALKLLTEKIKSFGTPDPSDSVATARASVVSDCTEAASRAPGIFTLTVPTGGGKTLSSLNFALRHALKHNKKRIIYVIPFTSIIEQNASVFQKLLASLGENIVLEHHSNLSPEKESTTSRLAAENWDAPIIVTTAVQFYESLFASKTSRSRKLHNIANSVVILDEAQCLPVNYLKPSLSVLEELSTHYNTTTVLCTATQPALAKSSDFLIGFPQVTEIIRDTRSLFASLSRVDITYRGNLTDDTISAELTHAQQALCIVNTRKHAQTLFDALPNSPGENFHLSTLMCPQHRLQILSTVRKRLHANLPVRLISTQLIEAGVDIDFPLVYRSMAGLDSIAQAAGRCNREGKLTSGEVHVFHSEHPSSERYFAQTANVGHQILDLHTSDPLSTSAVQAYFNKYYFQEKDRWDAKDILGDFQYASGDPKLPLLFNYRTAAEKFKLIENNQIPVIIPRDDHSKKLCDDLRNPSIPLHRNLLRALQRYTVQIYENEFHRNHHQFESARDGQFHILICPETHYDDNLGLNLNDEAPNSQSLIC
jgi:CRISPR-associated endonuclease/helicase Cas3